jgi:hypothetical protein
MYSSSAGRYVASAVGGWHSVNPGYYLKNKAGCGAYAYYSTVETCPAGSYCPGKTSVVCNSSNQATVHTTTFGLESCAKGTYQNATGQSSCKDCGAGKKTGVSGTGATTCSDCDVGTYSSGTANTTCTPCAAGYHQDATGKSSCKPCNNGQYQDETGKTSCKNCADGTYTPKNPVTAPFAACISCASNEISNSNHNGCDTCQASDGQISHNNQCRVCPSGTKVNTAGNGCEVCESGTYNESAKGSCDPCGSGFITDSKANTDSATTDIASNIGASAKTECYLNPELTLTDSINAGGVKLNALPGYGNNIYYVKPSSQK